MTFFSIIPNSYYAKYSVLSFYEDETNEDILFNLHLKRAFIIVIIIYWMMIEKWFIFIFSLCNVDMVRGIFFLQYTTLTILDSERDLIMFCQLFM